MTYAAPVIDLFQPHVEGDLPGPRSAELLHRQDAHESNAPTGGPLSGTDVE
jgi:hypothetical protein